MNYRSRRAKADEKPCVEQAEANVPFLSLMEERVAKAPEMKEQISANGIGCSGEGTCHPRSLSIGGN